MNVDHEFCESNSKKLWGIAANVQDALATDINMSIAEAATLRAIIDEVYHVSDRFHSLAVMMKYSHV